MLKRPSDGLWAGIFVGIVLVTVLMYFHVDVNGAKEPTGQALVTSDAAAEAFVGAWTTMAYGAWSVESTHTRLLTNGQTYIVNAKNVQSPPDYLDEAPSAISASVGGRSYTCASVDQGRVNGCNDTGASPPFAAYARSRVVAVQSAVIGENATYAVEAQNNDCYQVFLNPGQVANNWGNRARFCFDPKTGASTLTNIDKDGGSDSTQATQVVLPSPDELKIAPLLK